MKQSWCYEFFVLQPSFVFSSSTTPVRVPPLYFHISISYHRYPALTILIPLHTVFPNGFYILFWLYASSMLNTHLKILT